MSLPSRTVDTCLLLLALGLVSCTRPPEIAAHDPAPVIAATTDAGRAEPGSVPPATVPHAASALAPLAAGFDGYGTVPFGAGPQALRAAWDGELDGHADPSDPDACHYLFPQPRPEHGYGTAFMIEQGRLVRVDVDQPGAVAPGGGRIGMEAAQILALYPGQVEERPHKYVEGGSYLRVMPEDSATALVFEVAPDGLVQRWRVGLPPQVDYVEGCS